MHRNSSSRGIKAQMKSSSKHNHLPTRLPSSNSAERTDQSLQMYAIVSFCLVTRNIRYHFDILLPDRVRLLESLMNMPTWESNDKPRLAAIADISCIGKGGYECLLGGIKAII